MALQTGQILHNRYRIVTLLAQGGFGAVYRAWDISLNRSCALKENLETSPEAQRQFAREAQILASLSHPNLPRVTDHFVVPEQGQYLIMDFIEGEDLQEMLDRLGSPLSEDQALPWIEQICDALKYLHDQNPPIIHRDLKPANIKIGPTGKAILVDFGIAKTFDPSRGTTMGARGVTPGFSPPEQYGQGGTDSRSDVYALGATLYTLLTGLQPPDSVDVMSGVQPPPLPLQQVKQNASARVSAAIERAMQPAREQRFLDVGAFEAALLSAPRSEIIIPWPAVAGGSFLLLVFVSAVLFLLARFSASSPTPTVERAHPETASISIVSPAPTSTEESPLSPTITPSATLPPPTPTPSPVSPPLGVIVFTCFINEMDQICSINPDGSGYTQLTEASLTSWYASLSFDGGQILFSSRRTGTFEIYRMNLDGSQEEQLTTDPTTGAYAPALSPDGGTIVFANYVAGVQSIWAMDRDGGNPRALTDQTSNEWDPVWSPDGSQIAFASDRTGSRQLFIIDADGSNPRQITDFSDLGGRNNWSPDGGSLVFYAGSEGDHNIYRVSVADGSLQQLTDGGDNLSPCYSPDGQWLVFSSRRDGDLEIYVMRPDGSEVTQLTFNDYSDYQPWWGR